MAKSKQAPKPTVRVALDAEEITFLITSSQNITHSYPELLKKLQLAKFKAENEISISHVRTGKPLTQSQQLAEAFSEETFMEEIAKLEMENSKP